jgi:hypothetical protein
MTDIVSKFKSNQNKGIIWGLLNDHNVFNRIDNKYVTNIKTEFDNKINHISGNILNTDNLVALNKKVISEMIHEINKYRESSQPIQNNINDNANTNAMPITSADAQIQKQSLFQKNLETKQNEFDTLINKPKPNTIDFADNNGQDKPNSSEMERKLAETIAWREKELHVVLDTQNKSEATLSEASKWINKDNVSSGNNILLKIDKNTPVDINVIDLGNKIKKKVSFPDSKEHVLDDSSSPSFENNFLSLLKKKDNSQNNNSTNSDDNIVIMKTQIKEIMDKQNIMLDNQNIMLEKQNIILENQTLMLKFINELSVKPTDVVSPGITLEITE